MRMARAFIASVPMAIVLVAAVVVPLAVIPGTFGFQSWPSSHGERISESRVQETPRAIKVVQVQPNRVTKRYAGIAHKPAAARGATSFVAQATPAPVRRESTRLVATVPAHRASGSGPGNANPTSHPTPSTPA